MTQARSSPAHRFEPRKARIFSERLVITWLGRSTALVFSPIFRYLPQKLPHSPSEPKPFDFTRINPRFPGESLDLFGRCVTTWRVEDLHRKSRSKGACAAPWRRRSATLGTWTSKSRQSMKVLELSWAMRLRWSAATLAAKSTRQWVKHL